MDANLRLSETKKKMHAVSCYVLFEPTVWSNSGYRNTSSALFHAKFQSLLGMLDAHMWWFVRTWGNNCAITCS